MLFFLRLILSIDGVPFLLLFKDEWRHFSYWWKYKRRDWVHHQLHMLVRDRTVLSHTMQGCCDLAQCPADHWQPDPNWTLIEYFDVWVLYAVLKYKPTRRFFSSIDYANATEDQWMKHRVDKEILLAIRRSSVIVPLVCLLTREHPDGYRTQSGCGFKRSRQAREECWVFDGESDADYELREIAEDDWHEQERDARLIEWEEEFGSLYAQHVLWKWDASYYQKADAVRQQMVPKGLLDPECAERDEWHRRYLCSIHTLPEDGSWEQIRDAIWRGKDQVQEG